MTSLMHETTVWNGRFAKTTCSQCFVQIRSKGIKTMYWMLWLRAICKSCNISFSSTFTMFTFLGTIADCGAKLLKNTCYCIKLRLVWSRLPRFFANGNPARSVQQNQCKPRRWLHQLVRRRNSYLDHGWFRRNLFWTWFEWFWLGWDWLGIV